MSESLSSYPLCSIFDSIPSLVSAPVGCSIGQAFHTLAENNLYGVPLLDQSHQGNAYIDLQNVLSGIVSAVGVVDGSNLKEKISTISQIANTFLSSSVDSLVDVHSNPYVSLSVNNHTILDAIKELSGTARRIALTNSEGQVITIVSPSRICKALSYLVNDKELSKILSDQVANICERNVVVVGADELVINVARKMVETGKSSAAIVEENSFISVISVKDFKNFSEAQNWNKLFNSVTDFISEIRRNNPKDIFPAMIAHESDLLERVLLRFVATNVHRFFVVDENKQLTGVISQRDLLRKFSN